MSRRDHTNSKSVSGDELLRQEAAVYLSADAERQLSLLRQRRESVEAALQRLDVEVYDLESDYLKHCVSFGGSIFDGFGLERQTNAHRNPVGVLTPQPSASGGTLDSASTAASASPLLSRSTAGEQFRTYHFAGGGGDGGGTGTSSSGTHAAVYHVGSKGASAPAFHYRLHFFSPSERIFSACSVGALSRVEVAKSATESASGLAKLSSRGTASAPGSGRGYSEGKRGRLGRSGGGVAAAFAREPDAPPSRRRQREAAEDRHDSDLGGRRRRHTE